MTIDTKALRALAEAEAATPGPWRAVAGDGVGAVSADDFGCYVYLNVRKHDEHADTVKRWQADARFIAAASPDVVLALLDHIEELEAERDETREEREEHRRQYEAESQTSYALERKLEAAEARVGYLTAALAEVRHEAVCAGATSLVEAVDRHVDTAGVEVLPSDVRVLRERMKELEQDRDDAHRQLDSLSEALERVRELEDITTRQMLVERDAAERLVTLRAENAALRAVAEAARGVDEAETHLGNCDADPCVFCDKLRALVGALAALPEGGAT